jgi:hypothetical protein
VRNVVICDLDGTLANIDHRLALITKSKPAWDRFHAMCVDDIVNDWCAELLRVLYNDVYLIEIVSARPPTVKTHTVNWLNKHRIPFDGLHLLGDNKTPDQVLKLNWFNKVAPMWGHRIAFVIEDRQRVVDMWRSVGLVCLQPYSWKEINE